ncbi:MAG: RIP metalloprotease RseP [Cyclobacteriaceae bacterium]|nr:RIP metalloprotease RseP [Cyclobacteriaceae bacterium]
MVAQMILGLSILVGIHEFGHMIAAKMFGMRVEQFSIGFPPRIFSFQYGETRYSIGAIPLGGYVKISGMIDESMDTNQMKEEPKDWEFRSKPAWQRLIVMMAGIILNVITGIIVFVMLVYSQGEIYYTKDQVNKHGIVAYELGEEIGFKTGDKILKINGKDYDRFSDVLSADVLLESNSYYTVDRNGEMVEIQIPVGFIERFSDKRNFRFIEPMRPYKVGDVMINSGASKAGISKGDRLLEVEGEPVVYFHQIQEVLSGYKGKEVNVLLQRGESDQNLQELSIPVQVSEEGTIGFFPEFLLEYSEVNYSLAQAIPLGTTRAFSVVWLNMKAFGKMFKGELNPAKSVRGPLGIMKEFGTTWDWTRFWTLTGLLSMVLAFMNFLPIPALDGGHVAFLMYEIVSGRKPSDKFLENAQKVGMVLLLGLMAFVIFNDIIQEIF